MIVLLLGKKKIMLLELILLWIILYICSKRRQALYMKKQKINLEISNPILYIAKLNSNFNSTTTSTWVENLYSNFVSVICSWQIFKCYDFFNRLYIYSLSDPIMYVTPQLSYTICPLPMSTPLGVCCPSYHSWFWFDLNGTKSKSGLLNEWIGDKVWYVSIGCEMCCLPWNFSVPLYLFLCPPVN